MILAFFENPQSGKNVANLQIITIRLFGHYNSDPVGTFMEGPRSDSGHSSTDETTLLAAQTGKKKTMPGMETAAVRRTTSNVAMPKGRMVFEAEHDNGSMSTKNLGLMTSPSKPLDGIRPVV